MTNHTQAVSRRSFLQYAAVLGSGIAVGSILTGGAPTDRIASAALQATPDATATREAELRELEELRTKVAQPATCVAPPTATAIPPTSTATQVPLAGMGVPLPFHGIWTVTILGIAPTISPPDLKPAGQFMQINMTVSHSATTPKSLPITDFLLTDSAGRHSAIAIATNQSILGGTWALATAPGTTENRSVIFDVAADAGDTFILESPGDPTFRVELKVELLG